MAEFYQWIRRAAQVSFPETSGKPCNFERMESEFPSRRAKEGFTFDLGALVIHVHKCEDVIDTPYKKLRLHFSDLIFHPLSSFLPHLIPWVTHESSTKWSGLSHPNVWMTTTTLNFFRDVSWSKTIVIFCWQFRIFPNGCQLTVPLIHHKMLHTMRFTLDQNEPNIKKPEQSKLIIPFPKRNPHWTNCFFCLCLGIYFSSWNWQTNTSAITPIIGSSPMSLKCASQQTPRPWVDDWPWYRGIIQNHSPQMSMGSLLGMLWSM